MELSKEEKQRYSRQIVLPNFGVAAQSKLKKASVLVVGSGGLGCPCLLYLAVSGVGFIGIADDDCVSNSNLQRQTLFDERDTGRYKCEVAKEKLSAKNKNIRIVSHKERLTKQNVLSLIENYDIVIDGADNFEASYLLNDACVLLEKTLIYGSIFQYEGQLSVFNHKGGPTLRCLFPQMPSDLDNCSISGVFSALAGLIGVWQAAEALKIITGVGETLSGKLLIFNILNNTTDVLTFDGNPENKNTCFLKKNLTPEASLILAEIDAQTFQKQKNREEIQVIDVRNTNEFESFNAGGKNIPLPDLDSRMETINPNTETIVVCQSGMRSEVALKKIKEYYPNISISHLKGGLTAYTEFLKHSEK